jgi:hypothetical protein
MGMISAMREWPWLLRVTHAVFFLGMALAFVTTSTESDERWMFAVAPAALAASGLLLVLNVSGSATAYASSAAKYRPLGVDYSRSLFAKPWFARAFGGMTVLVGGVFLWVVVTQPL